MGKRNDMARDKDVDKSNKKSVSEAIRSMFEIKDDGNSVNKLKTQVKGYSVTAITERTLKKNKLGDAMTAVCSKKELEEEIRENLKKGFPQQAVPGSHYRQLRSEFRIRCKQPEKPQNHRLRKSLCLSGPYPHPAHNPLHLIITAPFHSQSEGWCKAVS